ncbi:uncharacterized protein TRAVEDRAFT_47283 [Trametes versicolor FP-101664 SS1]|uniref:uncharacterized protein n=1 Tax=Trametes versicolor (strain FP-101664) TaxID=717944 RepID=UPI0004624615|nr:uncharacterized protein TRAVEDRAFT_47283 [Trametes versicolor FP-101664 SS1]EIW58105.1 hypothetical protein TRAVEDRAFT_47283 [Trametes versicolor FP-101664 SS1]
MTSPSTTVSASDPGAGVTAHLYDDGSHRSAVFPFLSANAGPPPYDETSSATGLRNVYGEFDRDLVAMYPLAKATSGARLDAYLWDAAFGSAPGVQPRVQAVNGINLYSKKDTITGSYSIDPAISNTHSLNDPDAKAAEREYAHEAGRAENGWSWDWGLKQVGFKSYNACLQSVKTPAFVSVSSRHADIVVNVIEVQPGRSLQLDVGTRTGNILVLLPASFTGCIVFHSGDLDNYHTMLLPNLAPLSTVVQKTDRETTVSVNGPSQVQDGSRLQAKDQDCCVISTRTGRVAVGLSGVDQTDPNILWQESPLRRLGKTIEVGLLGGAYLSS